MPLQRRDIATLAIAAVCLVSGAIAFRYGWEDPGLVLGISVSDGRIYVDTQPWGAARRQGLLDGMVVVSLDERPLVSLPGAEIAAPAESELESLVQSDFRSLIAAWPGELARATTESGPQTFYFYRGSLGYTGPAFALGMLILLSGWWWLASGRGGAVLQPLAIPLAAATSAPLLLLPLDRTLSPFGILATSLLLVLAMIPLGLGFLDLIEDRERRRMSRLAVAAGALAALGAGLVIVVTNPFFDLPSLARWGFAGAVAFVPGFVAARPLGFMRPGGGSAPGRLVESTELAVAGATPGVAMATLAMSSPYDAFTLPILFWILAILAAGRFTVRPLLRFAVRAQLQRDLVVAATEAERARIAADLHDDALQEVSMLVRRLDAAGDAEGADLARSVADRLRAICGDLRLPILDDLGAGPALEWLVQRIERLAGGEVRLERLDPTRPPADVELAVFRIAQEALANAVKHGKAPIVVRYRVSDGGVSLSIDDAGPGIRPDAGEVAQKAGHFGLLNMQQRAEQIGAILDIRRWPAGGTHVALEWRR